MVGLSVSVLLLAPAAPAAPVPAPPPAPAVTAADRNQALNFAHMVYNAAQSVASQYSWPVNEPIDPTYFTQVKKLLGGSIRGLYEAAGLAVPDDAVRAAHSAANAAELLNALIDTRVRLGNLPALAGPRSLFAAVNGFHHATDQ